MINILYVYGDILRYGGMEIHMMNYFRNIDRKKIHIDFVVQTDGTQKGVFDDEIIASGSTIYYLPKMKTHPFKNYYGILKILGSKKYQIIHAHSDAMNYRYLKIAGFFRIPVRISHSHNTHHVLNNKVKYRYYEFCRKNIFRYATKCFACSNLAGRWMYHNHPFEVIPNAICLDKFKYNSTVSCDLRSKYGIADNEIVLGNVGRFDYQKNQEFLIEIIKELKDEAISYKLVMIGDGWKINEIKRLVDENELEEKVIFVGNVDTPQNYYNMMDVFLLPSRFEGFPLVLIEAQANGLKCIVSDHVTKEVNQTGQVRFCPLDSSKWVDTIKNEKLDRSDDSIKKLTYNGYEIKHAAKALSERYIQLYKEAVNKKHRRLRKKHNG